MNEIFNPKKLSETLRFFKTTERQQKYSILIDIISFSIIPSIFCMFINEESFNLYINFINNLNGEKNDGFILQQIFSRPLFIFPNFIQFIKKVFYPLLRPFYTSQIIFESDELIKKLKKDIINSVLTNILLCPFCIHLFLKKFRNDKNRLENLIFKCFFEPLIQFPSLYQIIDPWVTDSISENEKIIHILKKTIDIELIESIIQILINDKNFQTKKFPFSKDSVIIQGCKIINNIDNIVIDHFSQILLNDGIEKISIIEDIKTRNLEKYELMQFKFTEEFYNISFNNYNRDNYFNEIVNEIFNNDNIDDELDDTTILLNLVYTFYIKNHPDRISHILKSICGIDKKILKAKYQRYILHCSKDGEKYVGEHYMKFIFTQRFFSNIRFYDYIIFRVDLQKYDDIIYDYLSNQFGQFCQKFLERISNSSLQIKSVFENAIKNRSFLNCILLQFNDSFSENIDFISKLFNVERIINEILLMHFKLDFADLIYEDYVNAVCLIFAFIRPCSLVTNIIFMSEFSFNENPANINLISSKILNYCIDALNILFEFAIEKTKSIKCKYDFSKFAIFSDEKQNPSNSKKHAFYNIVNLFWKNWKDFLLLENNSIE